MSNSLSEIKLQSSASLLQALRNAKHIQITPKMLYNQKVSFAYSCFDKKSNVTKSEVKKMIDIASGEYPE